MSMDTFHSTLKDLFIPLVTVCGWVADLLPPLAALASIAWIAYQWYHSPPQVKRRAVNEARKISKVHTRKRP